MAPDASGTSGSADASKAGDDVVPPPAPADAGGPTENAAEAPPGSEPGAGLPQPRLEKKRRFRVSLVWLVPLVAVAVGISLLVRLVFLTGPKIEIEFASADGIEAGRTEVRYKEVVIGKVQTVALRQDRQRVIATVQLERRSGNVAVEDTSFWVVRPRIGAGGVSGLGTLLSGAYIGTDAGVSENERTHFMGLEAPPLVLRGEPGSIFVLRSDDLGSLDVGSPVFHRRARVGRVVGYNLDPVKDELSIKVFIEAPFQRLVTRETRFWNASGVDLTLNANGLTLNTQTLASVLAGGLAFEARPDTAPAPPAPENTGYQLFADRRSAMAPPDGEPLVVRMVFEQSVRGLAEDAPIDFLGVEIGRVRSFTLQYDAERKRFPVLVVAEVFPRRLGAVRTALVPQGQSHEEAGLSLFQRLADNGLRAQLRTGNLLTGQLYVAFDFIGRGTGRTSVSAADGSLTLPTAPGTLSEIQPQIADIVQKVSKIPFEEIGKELRSTLAGASGAIRQLTPEAQKAMAEVQKTLARAQSTLENLDKNVADPNAPVQRNVEETLLELQRAAQALRTLADYLQRHPESLLRGKPADAPLPAR